MKKTLFLILTVFSVIACQLETYYDVRLEATGSASKANITYECNGGEQLFNIDLPWELTDTVVSGKSFFLFVQSFDAVGIIIANIYIDGNLEKTETSADPFGFVAVYGETP